MRSLASSSARLFDGELDALGLEVHVRHTEQVWSRDVGLVEFE